MHLRTVHVHYYTAQYSSQYSEGSVKPYTYIVRFILLVRLEYPHRILSYKY